MFTLQDPGGRHLVVHPQDAATVARIEVDAEAENQRLEYVALTRAQVRLYLPRYGDKACSDQSMYWPIQRSLGSVDRVRGFRVLPIAVGAEQAEPAPADALAGFVAMPAPALGEPAAIDGARGGLAMLSYTRLAHDLHAEAPARASASDAPLPIDAQEFDVDDSAGEVGPNDSRPVRPRAC